MMTAQGRGYDFATYAALDRVNFSRLKLFEHSPAHYNANARQDTPTLSIGRLVHLALLEPAVFERTARVWSGGMTKDGRPTMNRNSQAYKDFERLAKVEGAVVVSQRDRDMCLRIAESVMSHPAARHLFEGGQAELSIEWTHRFGIECKSRVDYLGGFAIADLKTTQDVRPHAFNRSVHRYLYHAQAAFYQDAVEALTGERVPFRIVAVEKTAPYDVVVYAMGDAELDVGRKMYEGWLERLQECTETDTWPGVSQEPVPVELPAWAYDDLDTDLYIDGEKVSL